MTQEGIFCTQSPVVEESSGSGSIFGRIGQLMFWVGALLQTGDRNWIKVPEGGYLEENE